MAEVTLLEKSALAMALLGNIIFALASIFFTEFSRRRSVLWLNTFKALIALVAFALTVFLLRLAWPTSPLIYVCSLASGAMGLMIGDLFLLSAFTRIGPARTLMIFGFTPIILGLASRWLFNQDFPLYKLFAVLCLFVCVLSFSLEKFRTDGHWEWRGLLFAFAGVFLDACGLLLNKAAFQIGTESGNEVHPAMVNTLRCVGAMAVYPIVSLVLRNRLSLFTGFRTLATKDRVQVVVASFCGTYLSLLLYLSAVKFGHLASVSAVAMTSPVFAGLFECWRLKVLPNRYLLTGLFFFLIGLGILFGF